MPSETVPYVDKENVLKQNIGKIISGNGGFTMNSIYDTYTLNNGVKIPCVGFGTYKAADGKSADIITTAIEEGYRYLDTASFYDTEELVAEAVKQSGIPRKEFFIATKVWKTEMGYEECLKACEKSLKRLGTDYLDLYLIHWPLPETGYEDWKQLDIDTWRAMEKLYKEGKVRAIGVCNFLPHHLENLIENCEIIPALNQLEYHPGYTQEAAVQYCREKGIMLQAWSPMGRRRLFEEPSLKEMAEKYGVSVAKLCLRFSVQNRVIPLPKASVRERMKANMELFDFEISKEDMYRLNTLPQLGWSGEHPDRVRVPVEVPAEMPR